MLAYTLYSGALVPPGMCVCGSQTMPMLDTHRIIKGYGRVYLCPTCVAQAAHAHGYVARGDHDTVVAALEQQLADTRAELDRALAARVMTPDSVGEFLTAAIRAAQGSTNQSTATEEVAA